MEIKIHPLIMEITEVNITKDDTEEAQVLEGVETIITYCFAKKQDCYIKYGSTSILYKCGLPHDMEGMVEALIQ